MAEQSIAERLREGIIYHKKRWSGDTHTDMGSSVDEDATDAVMAQAADEIDRLTKERDEARGLLRRALEHDDVAFGGYARDLRAEIVAALNKDTANG